MQSQFTPEQTKLINSYLLNAKAVLKDLQEVSRTFRTVLSPKKLREISKGGNLEDSSMWEWQPSPKGLEEGGEEELSYKDTYKPDSREVRFLKALKKLPFTLLFFEQKIKDILFQILETRRGLKSTRTLSIFLSDEGYDDTWKIKEITFVLKKRKEILELLEGDSSNQVLLRDSLERLRSIRGFLKSSARILGENLYETLEKNFETLYHATTDLTSIMSKGFSANGLKESFGLGKNYGGIISFTHSLSYAKKIAQNHRIIAHIAKGSFNGSHLLKLVRAKGLAKKLQKKLFADGYLRPEGSPSRPLTHPERELPDKKLHSFSDLSKIKDPKNVFLIYSTYLMLLGASLKGFNPVYGGGQDISILGKKSMRDIGVIACEVDLRFSGVQYLPAEKEFRIPVKAIRSYKQVD